MNRRLLLAALTVVALATCVSAQPETPATPAPAAAPSKKEKPPIYDEKADAKAQIDAAISKAAKDHQRVLIQWGANWCGWCHLLHGTFKSDKAIAKELNYEYQVVLVDVGQFDKNMDLAKSLGADLKANGLPFLTVLDGGGKPIANQETGSLEAANQEKPGHDAAKVLAFLKKHEATPLKADDILASGLKEARASGRKVFLHFGAPWCVWCHRLEDWMARPEVAPILAKEFVDVKIDIDRATGGKAVLDRFRAGKDGGIPWFVFLDPASEGEPKPIASSDAPKSGNIGFPAQPEEIEHFLGMLRAAPGKLTPADLDAIKASLSEKPKAPAGSPATTPMTPLQRPDPKE